MVEADARIQPLNRSGFIFIFFLGFFILIFQTTVARWYDISGWSPDLILIIALYLGLHAPITSGVFLTVALGFLRDTAAGGVFGLSPAVYLPLLFVSALARRKLDPSPPWYSSLFVLAAYLVAGLLQWGFLYTFGWPLPHLSLTWSGPLFPFLVSAVLGGILGPPCFWILGRMRPQGGDRRGDEK